MKEELDDGTILVLNKKQPTLVVGDMWNSYDQIIAEDGRFLITTNSYINNDGSLAMGKGIAKIASQRFPDLSIQAGYRVQYRCGHLGEYGVVLTPHHEMPVGLFQTKTHFKNKSTLEMIAYSASILAVYANSTRARQFHVNFPGIGYGGLKQQDVLPILLDTLPSNVFIWKLYHE